VKRFVVAATALLSLFLPAALAPPAPAQALPGVVVVPDFPGDCSVDVTDRLQAILDAHHRDVTVRLTKNACYRVEGRLQITDAQHFTLDGNGAVVHAFTADGAGHAPPGGPDRVPNPQVRSHLKFVRGDTVTVVGMTLVGPHDRGRGYVEDFAFQHFVHLEGTRNVNILWNRATNIYGDFVYVTHFRTRDDSGGWNYTNWANVSVIGNRFSWNGRQGVAVAGAGSGLRITDNVFLDVRRSGLDIEPLSSDVAISDIQMLRNVFDNCRMGKAANFVSSLGAAAEVRDVVIQGNERRCGSLAMSVVSDEGASVKHNWLIAGNHATAPQDGGRLLWFVGVQKLWIVGNTAPYIECGNDTPTGAAACPLELARVSSPLVAANTFTVQAGTS
jgi:hypothetical protein